MKHHSYGAKSTAKLLTCHSHMQEIAKMALELSPYDITLIHGWRGEQLQNDLFDSGASTKQWPDSKHNGSYDSTLPDVIRVQTSDALDYGPYIDGGVPWHDPHVFSIIAGCFHSAAAFLDYKLRYGGDWDGDGKIKGDQTLMDWGHVEVVF